MVLRESTFRSTYVTTKLRHKTHGGICPGTCVAILLHLFRDQKRPRILYPVEDISRSFSPTAIDLLFAKFATTQKWLNLSVAGYYYILLRGKLYGTLPRIMSSPKKKIETRTLSTLVKRDKILLVNGPCLVLTHLFKELGAGRTFSRMRLVAQWR